MPRRVRSTQEATQPVALLNEGARSETNATLWQRLIAAYESVSKTYKALAAVVAGFLAALSGLREYGPQIRAYFEPPSIAILEKRISSLESENEKILSKITKLDQMITQHNDSQFAGFHFVETEIKNIKSRIEDIGIFSSSVHTFTADDIKKGKYNKKQFFIADSSSEVILYFHHAGKDSKFPVDLKFNQSAIEDATKLYDSKKFDISNYVIKSVYKKNEEARWSTTTTKRTDQSATLASNQQSPIQDDDETTSSAPHDWGKLGDGSQNIHFIELSPSKGPEFTAIQSKIYEVAVTIVVRKRSRR